MLAVVRMPRTRGPALQIRGRIPSWMLSRLRREYGKNLIVRQEPKDSEELVDALETPWFKELDAEMNPGDSVRVYRENAGLTQVELGKKLGNVPRQNISAMEKGRRGISKAMAKRLSRILRAPVERFL
jgi:DNA-binding XRE family transcriptional regulator